MSKKHKAAKAEEERNARPVYEQPGATPQMQTSGVPAAGENGGYKGGGAA
jgi:hypothetical protein